MAFEDLRPQSKVQWAVTGAVGTLFLVALITVIHPGLRESVRDAWNPGFRRVLSTANGPLLENDSNCKVIKIKTQNGIFLEIYGDSSNGGRPLLERIQLPDPTDGYFDFRGQATNLALYDVNNDQRLEILAPTFDRSLQAHLNVYRYNTQTENFELLGPGH